MVQPPDQTPSLPEAPLAGSILSVTQFVSYLFFLTLFAKAVSETDLASKGFGLIPPGMASGWLARIWAFAILWIICFGTGARTYLSFWNVEQNEEFQALRMSWGRVRRSLDWFFCRALCFFCINLFPIAIGYNTPWWIELLLIASYLIMVIWDIWIGIGLCLRDGEQRRKCFTLSGSKRGHFKSQIRLWTHLEIVGLIVTILYLGLVMGLKVLGHPELLTFALGMLVVATVYIVVRDVRWNWKDYKWTIWCSLAVIPLLFLVRFLGHK